MYVLISNVKSIYCDALDNMGPVAKNVCEKRGSIFSIKHVLWCESTLLFNYEHTYLMKVILETRRPFWYVWYQLTRTDDWTGAPKYEDFNMWIVDLFIDREQVPVHGMTYLFSIKYLYFFIISSLFPYFNLFVSIFIQS